MGSLRSRVLLLALVAVPGLLLLDNDADRKVALPAASLLAHADERGGAASPLTLPPKAAEVLGEARPLSAGSNKRVAVVLLTFTDSLPRNVSDPRDVRATYFGKRSVASYYREVSYGQVSVTGEVFGPWPAGVAGAGCRFWEWVELAATAAQERGVDLSGFDVQVLFTPYVEDCEWGGLGGGTTNWINGFLDLGLAAHELGHSFGSMHASTYRCASERTRVILAAAESCETDEYGDPFDVMGAKNTSGPNGFHRFEMGFLSDVQTITKSGFYRLLPLSSPAGAGSRLLRVDRPGGENSFYLDYRSLSGQFDRFAPESYATRGVGVRLAREPRIGGGTLLLDARPETKTLQDAPLLPGDSFQDPESPIRITVLSVGKTGASVSVQFEPPTAAALAVSAPVALRSTRLSSGSVQLSWRAPITGAFGFRVYRDRVYLGSTRSTSFLDDSAGLSNSYRVVAFDTNGNLSPATTALRAWRPVKISG